MRIKLFKHTYRKQNKIEIDVEKNITKIELTPKALASKE